MKLDDFLIQLVKYCNYSNICAYGDELMDQILLCPNCAKGMLSATEIISDEPDERIVVYHFSCGHKLDAIEVSVKTILKAEVPVITSGAGATVKIIKTGPRKGSPIREYEIKEKFRSNDKDQSGRPTEERYYRIMDHDDYHAVKYSDLPDPVFKHIDCKRCGNDWKCQSKLPIEDYFLIEHRFSSSVYVP